MGFASAADLGASMNHQDRANTTSAITSALNTLRTERAGLDALMVAIDNGLGDLFEAATRRIGETIAAKGRVIVTGMGKSGHVGRKIAATLASTGTPAHFLHPGEASHGDLGMVQPEDCILALSWSGEAAELTDVIAYCGRFKVCLLAITSAAESTLAREADVALVLPRAEEACAIGLAPTTSTTMQMALGDALAVAMMESRGFSARDFRVFHPGGKLGARLTFVRDVMHALAKVPLVPEDASMGDAILEMTARGLGTVGVTDNAGTLIGVVTDGDLRRHMRDNLTALPVRDVMTRNPRATGPDVLLGEALEMINTARITALFVVDADKVPVGIVHVHDLLKMGAA